MRFSGSYAISVDFAGAAVLDCVIAESGGGVQAGGGAFVARNSVCFGGPGLSVNDRSIVIDNQVMNCASGISVASLCRVEGNNVAGCETGIRAGDGNTVRANAVADCGTHYLGETPGSLYVNNTSHGPGVPFSLPPGTTHGPIVNVAGVGDISGTPGAAHPWANLIY